MLNKFWVTLGFQFCFYITFDCFVLFSVVKEGICLPPYLFEDLQSKGLEICWPIPHKYLKVCLSFRDALNWSNVEAIHGVMLEEDFLNMAKTDLPIERLSFKTLGVTQQMVNVIERFAPYLKVLEICKDVGSRYSL